MKKTEILSLTLIVFGVTLLTVGIISLEEYYDLNGVISFTLGLIILAILKIK
jgi:hypothetical protein